MLDTKSVFNRTKALAQTGAKLTYTLKESETDKRLRDIEVFDGKNKVMTFKDADVQDVPNFQDQFRKGIKEAFMPNVPQD